MAAEDGHHDRRLAGSSSDSPGRRSRLFAGVGVVLLLMYFLNSFALSFPLTAYRDWLTNELKMPPATQQIYYAMIFLPNSLKPLYAVVVERYPIADDGRKVWTSMTASGTALMYLVQAAFVRDWPTAFVGSFVLNVMYTFSELLLGAALMDVAHRDMRNAGAVQAASSTARYLGSISAALLNLAFYSCDAESATFIRNPRFIIGLTGLASLSVAFLARFLPKAPIDEEEHQAKDMLSSTQLMRDEEGDGVPMPDNAGDGEMSRELLTNHEKGREARSARDIRRSGRFALGLVLAEAVLLWVTIKSLVNPIAFFSILSVLVVTAYFSVMDVFLMFSGTSVIEVIMHGASFGRAAGSIQVWLQSSGARKYLQAVGPAVFLFTRNAVPNFGLQFNLFTFELFYKQHPCRAVYLTLAAETASLVSCVFYGLLARRRRVQVVIASTALIAASVQLAAIPLIGIEDSSDHVYIGSIKMSPWTYSVLLTIAISFVLQLAFVPIEVLATESCPKNDRVFAYAVYLAFIDFGNSVSDWLTAPLVTEFGITSDDFSGLKKLLLVSVGCQVGVLALVPLLTRNFVPGSGDEHRRRTASEASEDSSASEFMVSDRDRSGIET